MSRVIGLKIDDIKGDVSAELVKDNILVESVQGGASATINYDSNGGGNASLQDIIVSIKYGDWVALLLADMFSGKQHPEITITEIDQAAANQNQSELKVVRTLKLTKAWVSGCTMSWSGQTSSCTLTLSFEKWHHEYNDKTGKPKVADKDLMAST